MKEKNFIGNINEVLAKNPEHTEELFGLSWKRSEDDRSHISSSFDDGFLYRKEQNARVIKFI